MSEVKVGQIWKDRDYRMHGRKFRILEVSDSTALCKTIESRGHTLRNGIKRRISLKRFKPTSTGYDLVSEGF